MWAIYGMGGGKGPKPQADYKDFLPFPEAQKRVQSEADAAQLQETRAALQRALAKGTLPYDIFIELWRGPRA